MDCPGTIRMVSRAGSTQWLRYRTYLRSNSAKRHTGAVQVLSGCVVAQKNALAL